MFIENHGNLEVKLEMANERIDRLEGLFRDLINKILDIDANIEEQFDSLSEWIAKVDTDLEHKAKDQEDAADLKEALRYWTRIPENLKNNLKKTLTFPMI